MLSLNIANILLRISTYLGRRKQHKLKGFGRFEREVNEEFDKMMKLATERLTDLCKIEKRVWNKHEDVIDQYDDLITEVDDRTEQQVCVIIQVLPLITDLSQQNY